MRENSLTPLISVVVCTYNRADLLSGCLRSLAEQTLDKSLYEVIVVNNNSTDNTLETAEGYAAIHTNFRVVSETRQGLSHARNRGYMEGRGEYVAYIDDDAKAYPDWILQMKSFIERHPDIKVFGGSYDAFSLVDIADWFPPEYGSLDLGDEERPIRVGHEWITGSNMVIRKDLLSSRGGFNINLGMKGNTISYGEETRFFLDLAAVKVPIYYVPKMKVRHLIAEYKLNLKWLLLSNYSIGRCMTMTFNKRQSLLTLIVNIGYVSVKAIIKMFSFESIPFKRRIYYSFAPVFIQIGVLIDYFESLRANN
ncbi:MAG: glycosyltransferase family A protein [Deltaproteobacteria bacterium]|nr:glycosyltransferase family A protein [Deltaproteobacteria bacterium]